MFIITVFIFVVVVAVIVMKYCNLITKSISYPASIALPFLQVDRLTVDI